MVAGCRADSRLIEKVAEIYGWLHSQIRRHGDLAGLCDACGKCCNFGGPTLASEQEPVPGHDKRFDHRLFVSTPELTYLTATLGAESIKPMPTSRCPYNIGGRCTVYEYRFAGCRIFCCNGDADFQSRLSESALKKLRSVCTEFQIPYRYTDLATALNDLTGV